MECLPPDQAAPEADNLGRSLGLALVRYECQKLADYVGDC